MHFLTLSILCKGSDKVEKNRYSEKLTLNDFDVIKFDTIQKKKESDWCKKKLHRIEKKNDKSTLNKIFERTVIFQIVNFHFYFSFLFPRWSEESIKLYPCPFVHPSVLPSFRTSKIWFLFSKFRLPQPNIMELNFALTVLQLCPCTNGNITDFFISLPQNADRDWILLMLLLLF